MNTRDISAFIAVVEAGSIVQAAAAMHLTQPAVTRRMQSLETLLGVELLDRQSKPLRPTAAGREVYEKGRQVLQAEADLMALVREDAEPSGELRLGMPPYLADLTLATPVDCLRERFPRLTLRIQTSWSQSLVEHVEQGMLDAAVIGVAENTAPPAGMTAHAFGRQPVKIVASPALNLRTRVSLKDLSAFPWVLSQNGCGMRSALRRSMEAQGLPFDVAVEAIGADLQLSLVSRGVGVGMIAADLLATSAYREKLKVLAVSDFKSDIVAWLVHRPLPPRLKTPVALLLQELEKLASKQAGTRRVKKRA
jgi:DNA-binding transcriptional LysR family regulator